MHLPGPSHRLGVLQPQSTLLDRLIKKPPCEPRCASAIRLHQNRYVTKEPPYRLSIKLGEGHAFALVIVWCMTKAAVGWAQQALKLLP